MPCPRAIVSGQGYKVHFQRFSKAWQSPSMPARAQVWMITGDKQETAINIAIACKLVHHIKDLLIVNAHQSEEAAKARLDDLLALCKASSLGAARGTVSVKAGLLPPCDHIPPHTPPQARLIMGGVGKGLGTGLCCRWVDCSVVHSSPPCLGQTPAPRLLSALSGKWPKKGCLRSLFAAPAQSGRPWSGEIYKSRMQMPP